MGEEALPRGCMLRWKGSRRMLESGCREVTAMAALSWLHAELYRAQQTRGGECRGHC